MSICLLKKKVYVCRPLPDHIGYMVETSLVATFITYTTFKCVHLLISVTNSLSKTLQVHVDIILPHKQLCT